MKIIDMHCDTISRLRTERKENVLPDHKTNKPELRSSSFQIDLEKMKKGSYLLQNFALFVNLSEEEDPYWAALEMVHLFFEEMEHNQDIIRPVTSYKEIEENKKSGLMSALLTLEEGEICKGSLEHLKHFYDLGIRMMTLTWNFENQLGFPNRYPKRRTNSGIETDSSSRYPFYGSSNPTGLTKTGLEFLEEMEHLGIIIDVSHLSDGGFYDVYNHTHLPFVASHSNARSLCKHCRNLTDDMIQKIGQRGGVIGLNFYGNFLDFHEDGTPGQSTAACIARHARYITNLGGMDCLGLGSDFDGFAGETELSDCSMLYLLEEALRKQGFSSGEIDKIFYRNVLRLYQELL